MRKLNELKSLRNLRPCVDSDLMLRVEARLETLNSLWILGTRS